MYHNGYCMRRSIDVKFFLQCLVQGHRSLVGHLDSRGLGVGDVSFSKILLFYLLVGV